jgi:2'-5' RNA ligase
MKKIRSFIAFDLSNTTLSEVRSLSETLKIEFEAFPLRWVNTANVHLTLKFLGEIDSVLVKQIGQVLTETAASIPPFELTYAGIGSFPSVTKPRVIWLGVRAGKYLADLHLKIEQECSGLGIPLDNRSFNPHLTIARVSRDAHSDQVKEFGQNLAQVEVGFLGVDLVDQVHLYQSELKRSGAEYTKLFSADFSNET